MREINSVSAVKAQYADSANLTTRISIHDKYSVNRQGFGNWIVSHYHIEPGMRVLELGCGTGSMWRGHEDLVKACGELILSDLSPGMLETAKVNVSGPNVRHMVMDIQDIPFGGDSFDIVIANMMLYHVPDLTKALSQVRRVLKAGGVFYCATYGEHGILEYLSELLAEFGAQDRTNRSFTLRNGAGILKTVFSHVEKREYPDALAVTDLDDMVEYIFSLSSMTALSGIPRQTIKEALARHTINGVLTVPKEYGMFVCR